ncbi:MAG: hypothetical protein ACM30I_14310 [Gemmatimonas sp.]
MDLSEHIVNEFRAKAEELREFAGTHADPWRRTVILRFARDCEVLADEYQHQLSRRRRREQ